jgi:hypothetical protein
MKSSNYNYDCSAYLTEVEKSFNEGKISETIGLIVKAVDEIIKKDDALGKHFYLNEFDNLLVAIAEKIKIKFPKYISQFNSTNNSQALILATEIYSAGGHTNVIKDIVELYPQTDIILSDLFGRYQKNKWIDFTKLIPLHTSVLILPNEDVLKKILRLANHIKKFSGPVFLFNHQHDVAILIAALLSESKNIYFVHHADYSPCLGCTIENFIHIDLFKDKFAKCSNSLNSRLKLIPLAVKDLGLKPSIECSELNTVTSGSFNKYLKTGDLSYKNIVEKILKTINGKHYHIGKIDNDYLFELKSHLESTGIDFNRFLYVESVPSLWEALKSINAAIYIASAPINGGRTEIEAQGCGYPIISFKDETKPVLEYSLHSPTTLYYSNLDELGLRINESVERIHQLSESSRSFYLENFDFKFMKNEIDLIFEKIR